MTDVLISRAAPSDEELTAIVELGKAFYATYKVELEAIARDHFVSIDVDTGDYAIADTPATAAKQLLVKNPQARLYGAKIGHEAMLRI